MNICRINRGYIINQKYLLFCEMLARLHLGIYLQIFIKVILLLYSYICDQMNSCNNSSVSFISIQEECGAFGHIVKRSFSFRIYHKRDDNICLYLGFIVSCFDCNVPFPFVSNLGSFSMATRVKGGNHGMRRHLNLTITKPFDKSFAYIKLHLFL